MGEKIIIPHIDFEDEDGNYAYTQLYVEGEVLSDEELRELFPEDFPATFCEESGDEGNNIIPFPSNTPSERP